MFRCIFLFNFTKSQLKKQVHFINKCKFINIYTLTSAPITPRDVRRRYSKGRVLLVVCKNGYKYKGI